MRNGDEIEEIRTRFLAGNVSSLDVEILLGMVDALIARLAEETGGDSNA